jgi:hypothetical protein
LMNSANADTLRAIMQRRRPEAGAWDFFSFSFSEFNTEQTARRIFAGNSESAGARPVAG